MRVSHRPSLLDKLGPYDSTPIPVTGPRISLEASSVGEMSLILGAKESDMNARRQKGVYTQNRVGVWTAEVAEYVYVPFFAGASA